MDDHTLTTGESASASRRQFLGKVGGATMATIAAGAVGLEPLLGSSGSIALAQDIGEPAGSARADAAFRVRFEAAVRERAVPIPAHPDNDDEARFPGAIGNFSK